LDGNKQVLVEGQGEKTLIELTINELDSLNEDFNTISNKTRIQFEEEPDQFYCVARIDYGETAGYTE
jgi:hypothetical protein